MYFLGMVAGFSFVLLVSALYFMLTNKNIFGYLDKETKQSFKTDKEIWVNLSGNGLADRVDFYLTRRFRIRPIRDITHYSETLLKKVFRQHHLNAFLLIILILIILVSLGFVIDKPIFEIPAAGSLFLLFSVMISFFSLARSAFSSAQLAGASRAMTKLNRRVIRVITVSYSIQLCI